MNARAVAATSRQPLSMSSACPRLGSSTISVTPGLRCCFLSNWLPITERSDCLGAIRLRNHSDGYDHLYWSTNTVPHQVGFGPWRRSTDDRGPTLVHRWLWGQWPSSAARPTSPLITATAAATHL